MNNIFNDIETFIDIVSEKQYEDVTGEKLSGVNNDNVVSLEDSDRIDFNEVAIQSKKSLPHLINTSEVKTNNKFIKQRQLEEIDRANKMKKYISECDNEFPYVKREIMTPAEMKLFHFMKQNLGYREHIEIFTKVRLADIVDVDSNITTDKSFFYKICAKHLDFVICKATTLDIICVVELDDFTHNTKERQESDAFIMQVLYTAGIPIRRYKYKIETLEKRDLDPIDDLIYDAFSIPCPRCGLKMLVKKNRKTGKKFYACLNNIDCRLVINIE